MLTGIPLGTQFAQSFAEILAVVVLKTGYTETGDNFGHSVGLGMEQEDKMTVELGPEQLVTLPKQGRQMIQRWNGDVEVKKNQQFSFGHVKLKVPTKYQDGDVKLGVKFMSLELREEVKTRKMDLGVISIQMH